ncbi:MAG TPA: xanthine dehydrogenase, partial [Phaeodactylibacter sp.]|nr:xanthine dehydrogenase [Phaeodactylibacter sp.]
RQAAEMLQSEISPISDVRGSESYKRQLATQLLFAHLAKALGKERQEEHINENTHSSLNAPPLSGLPNTDSDKHLRGESLYVDDLPLQHGSLHALVFDAPVAHAEILELSVKEAEAAPGVVRILTAADIPGENQIGNIIPDEPLFAERQIHYCGQPLALILAETPEAARFARERIRLRYRELPPVTTEEEAYEKGMFITPPRTFLLGRPDEAFAKCKYVFEGKTCTNGQEHLYLETQSAYALPAEGDNIKIISSTQGPSQVQKAAAKVLGLPMHKIEVEVIRLGGGFGGKEDQATPWGVMAALGARVCKRPVKLVLDRHQDLRATGKRHPYTSYYKIGLDEELRIRAYEVKFLQNAGAAADLSPAVAERTLFHATNSYFVENVRATVYSCKTNLPPNTAFRGFGGPQGMFVIEAAIARAASELGVPARHIQELNLLREGNLFPYGQKAEQALARQSWQTAREQFGLDKICRKAEEFNKKSTYIKKGVALMPICFGISFTNTSMNQARALVHVYADGSVGVSTGAVEMGQGVNTKLLQIAAQAFSIDHRRVKIETTNTTRVANTSPSAASATTDLNGKALLKACTEIKNRLLRVAAKQLHTEPKNISLENERVLLKGEDSGLSWVELIQTALQQRVSLSETAHYATPRIQFDKQSEKGQPFSYHVYGTAIVTAAVDCLRGRYEIESVQIAHDFGKSMNLYIDRGQIEGGLVQGLGWMCMEEVVYDEQGRLRSNALSTYKVPDIFAAPRRIDITPVIGAEPEAAIFKSKAVGEPPLMYGIGAYFAILNAIKAYRPDAPMQFDAPFTPEKVLRMAGIKQSIHEEQA